MNYMVGGEEEKVYMQAICFLFPNSILKINEEAFQSQTLKTWQIVKLRERVGQRVDLEMSLKGHL